MKFFVLILSTLLANTFYSQVTLRGTILDSDTKQPVPFAKIVILNTDNKIIGGANSDFDGFYSIKNFYFTIPYFNIEVRNEIECYQLERKDSLSFEKDTVVNFQLSKKRSLNRTEYNCIHKNDSCQILNVIHRVPNSKTMIPIIYENNTQPDFDEKTMILFSTYEYYDQYCLEKKLYCKPYDYRF